MAFMRIHVLLLLVLASCAASAWAQGTVVELHKFTFFVGPPVWVVPDPTVASPGAPMGCTNLPPGFEFTSGRFYWNETAGKGICHFLWFFFDTNCAGGARGVQVPDKPVDGSAWVSQDAIYSRTTYWKIQNGKSIGCSFKEDPCEAFPCADTNAQCNSTYGWTWKDDQGLDWASQQRDCSACKEGFYKINGTDKCVSPAEACRSLACEAPATCQIPPGKGPQCLCPANQVMDEATGKCKEARNPAAWLSALNTVRDQAATSPGQNSAAGLQKTASSTPPPLQWDDGLAEIATNWTLQLNATQCGADPVVLTKIPGGNYSESDVWVSWANDESSAVQLWAPSPSDTSNPRTARITSQDTQLTGCGKTLCGTGAFFTCLFWPKTF